MLKILNRSCLTEFMLTNRSHDSNVRLCDRRNDCLTNETTLNACTLNCIQNEDPKPLPSGPPYPRDDYQATVRTIGTRVHISRFPRERREKGYIWNRMYVNVSDGERRIRLERVKAPQFRASWSHQDASKLKGEEHQIALLPLLRVRLKGGAYPQRE
jgi:hypothetical protein